MEYRQLGRSGMKVPALSLGTATFGGAGAFFERWGTTQDDEAQRIVDLSLDRGISLFDTADVYSRGLSEEILGKALKGKRDRALIATKSTFPMGTDPNEVGSSRHHLLRACEASLKRLQTDHIDIYFMHGFDALTPVDETLRALDDLLSSGKISYIGASNFSGWQVMKALATSEKYGLARYVVYQGCYSLVSRHYEWELMPLALDQGVGTIVENCGNTLILRCSASEHGGTSEFASKLIGQREVVHTTVSTTCKDSEWIGSTTTGQNLKIEPAVMASEIERLPDLSGLLKLASVPDWLVVRLTPMTGAAPVRPRRPSVLTSPPTAGPAAVRTTSPPAAVAPIGPTKARRARQIKAAAFRARVSPRGPAAESSPSQGVTARVTDTAAASVQPPPGAAE